MALLDTLYEANTQLYSAIQYWEREGEHLLESEDYERALTVWKIVDDLKAKQYRISELIKAETLRINQWESEGGYLNESC